MSFYPQIGSGVVAQFPFKRTRQWRAITNQLESGELITLPDAAGGQVGWSLRYEDITATEAQAIRGLFISSEGQFGSFTFIDPMANLLGWSEDFTRAGWQLGELILTARVADPFGTQRASAIANGSPGTLQLSQTLGISGDYVACFSAYVRADSAASVTMQRDGTADSGRGGPAVEASHCIRYRSRGRGTNHFFYRYTAWPDGERLGPSGGSTTLAFGLQTHDSGHRNLRGNIFRGR